MPDDAAWVQILACEVCKGFSEALGILAIMPDEVFPLLEYTAITEPIRKLRKAHQVAVHSVTEEVAFPAYREARAAAAEVAGA